MMLTWKPTIDDITAEIARVKEQILLADFDSNFGHQMHMAKLRTHELNERLMNLFHMNCTEAAALKHQVDASLAMLKSEAMGVRAQLADLRQLRAERARANYLHCQQLKALAEAEKGGEA